MQRTGNVRAVGDIDDHAIAHESSIEGVGDVGFGGAVLGKTRQTSVASAVPRRAT